MCPVLVCLVYMRVGMCCWDVYSDSAVCTVVVMWFHVLIWDFWCFSAVTDVLVDYLTNFYNNVD